MSAAKVILLVLHIISAGALISQFLVEIAMNRFASRTGGQPGGQLLGMAQGQVVGFLGQLGGLGILVTGLGLLGVDGYALFGINGFTPTWLLIKQVLFLISLIIVGAVITRGAREMQAAAAAGNPPAGIPPRVLYASRVVNLLVLINIVLAVWKPM